jgi:hypothetical protein
VHRPEVHIDPLPGAVELRDPPTPRTAAVKAGVLRAMVVPVVAMSAASPKRTITHAARRKTQRLKKKEKKNVKLIN